MGGKCAPLQGLRTLNSGQLQNAMVTGQETGARIRPEVRRAEPSMAGRCWPPKAKPQHWARGSEGGGGHCPGSFPPQALAAPPGCLSSPEPAPGLLSCFLPLYRALFRIREGSASSSWRQEGACSQGHLELRRGKGMSQPRVPSRARDQPGTGRGLGPFLKPSTGSDPESRATETQGSLRGQLKVLPQGLRPTPSPESTWATHLLDH